MFQGKQTTTKIITSVTTTRIIKVLSSVPQSLFRDSFFALQQQLPPHYPPSTLSSRNSKPLPPKHTSTKQKDLGQWYKTGTCSCTGYFTHQTIEFQICVRMYSTTLCSKVVMWFFWLNGDYKCGSTILELNGTGLLQNAIFKNEKV